MKKGQKITVIEDGYGFSQSSIGQVFVVVEYSEVGYDGDPGVKVKSLHGKPYENEEFDDFVGVESFI